MTVTQTFCYNIAIKYLQIIQLQSVAVTILTIANYKGVIVTEDCSIRLRNSYHGKITKTMCYPNIRYSLEEFNTTIKSKGDPTYWRSIDGDIVHLPEGIGR